jgi:hypothetical protein
MTEPHDSHCSLHLHSNDGLRIVRDQPAMLISKATFDTSRDVYTPRATQWVQSIVGNAHSMLLASPKMSYVMKVLLLI